jgi:prevent-host-death family protein
MIPKRVLAKRRHRAIDGTEASQASSEPGARRGNRRLLFIGQPGQAIFMPPFISLHEAKTKLFPLVERAAAGEEIVIVKNGILCARLVPIVSRGQRRTPANAMRIQYIAPDFDAPDLEIERLFFGLPHPSRLEYSP